MTTKKDVGLNVRTMRRRAGLKQAELVRKVIPSISVNTLSRIETGEHNYSIDLLFNMATTLNCDVSNFFNPKGKRPLKFTIVEGDPRELIEKIIKERISKIRG